MTARKDCVRFFYLRDVDSVLLASELYYIYTIGTVIFILDFKTAKTP